MAPRNVPEKYSVYCNSLEGTTGVHLSNLLQSKLSKRTITSWHSFIHPFIQNAYMHRCDKMWQDVTSRGEKSLEHKMFNAVSAAFDTIENGVLFKYHGPIYSPFIWQIRKCFPVGVAEPSCTLPLCVPRDSVPTPFFSSRHTSCSCCWHT